MVAISANELDASADFYTKVFAWQTHRMSPELVAAVTPAGPTVSLRAGTPDGFPGVVPFLRVADVDTALERAIAAGGSVERATWSVPMVGNLARFRDTSGTIYGLTSAMPPGPRLRRCRCPFGSNPKPAAVRSAAWRCMPRMATERPPSSGRSSAGVRRRRCRRSWPSIPGRGSAGSSSRTPRPCLRSPTSTWRTCARRSRRSKQAGARRSATPWRCRGWPASATSRTRRGRRWASSAPRPDPGDRRLVDAAEEHPRRGAAEGARKSTEGAGETGGELKGASREKRSLSLPP
ncbi:MAG: hypothetical protein IPK72_22390 [Candidatus Eisenbacteria bacterium]|nr:hypothetical protein [Candidatus Eisenbacteria bacterium]